MVDVGKNRGRGVLREELIERSWDRVERNFILITVASSRIFGEEEMWLHLEIDFDRNGAQRIFSSVNGIVCDLTSIRLKVVIDMRTM